MYSPLLGDRHVSDIAGSVAQRGYHVLRLHSGGFVISTAVGVSSRGAGAHTSCERLGTRAAPYSCGQSFGFIFPSGQILTFMSQCLDGLEVKKWAINVVRASGVWSTARVTLLGDAVGPHIL